MPPLEGYQIWLRLWPVSFIALLGSTPPLPLADKEPAPRYHSIGFELRDAPHMLAVVVLRRASMCPEEMQNEGADFSLAWNPAADICDHADFRSSTEFLFECAPPRDCDFVVVFAPVDVEDRLAASRVDPRRAVLFEGAEPPERLRNLGLRRIREVKNN